MGPSSDEREVYSSDSRERILGLSSDPKRVPQQGVIFTAYGTSPLPGRGGNANSPQDLRIGAFSRITGYLQQASPFCSIRPQPAIPYRLVISEDPQTQGHHNFFKAVVLRPLVAGEPRSFGFVEPDVFEEIVRIAYYGNKDPQMCGRSLIYDLQHLRTVDPKALERWLK